MPKHEYIDVILLQYQPYADINDSIEKIKQLVEKNHIKKNTLVVCPELSLQQYICITKSKKNFDAAISINCNEIFSIKDIAIKYKLFLCI